MIPLRASFSAALMVLAALMLSAVPTSAAPPTAGPARLTPERLFADPDLNGPSARGVAISPDGKLVTFLKAKDDDQTTLDLWAMPTSGGAARRLVDGGVVEPAQALLSEAEKARRERQRVAGVHGVTDYDWDEQGRAILVPAGGDLYLADAASGAVRRLTRTAADETDARFSPKGNFVSFVRDGALHALDLAKGSERTLSPAGAGAVSYATAEFVAQEEMDRFTGYWWSPDEARVAYTRVDEAGVDVLPRFEIGAEGVAAVEQRYPRAGRPNARVELYVQPLAGGVAVKVDLGADPDIYLARVDWSADGATLYVQRESRDQKRLDLLMVDPATGRARVILTETGDPWIDLNDNFTALKSGEFLWGSERTGFNHLYLYTREGRLIRAVTHGDWPVVGAASGSGRHSPGVAGVAEAAGLVYFVASKDTPLERHLYVVSYKAPGEPTRITQGAGWWTVTLAKDARSFVGGYSDPTTPPRTGLYSIDGRGIGWIEENALKPGHPFEPYAAQAPTVRFGAIHAGDGTKLQYALSVPPDFDPARRYPVIVSVYGGPSAQTVDRQWGPLSDQLLTGAGYLVFRLDNRGSGNRGLKFAGALAGRLGEVEVQDQLAGARWLQAQPFVDPERMGVMGWSYGGYMTLRLLTEPGTPFRAGAAGAPPTDWRFYDTHYTERFMGDPAKLAAAYDASAVLPRLPALAKPGAPRLLLLQGMADDNVTFDNSTRVMAALQAQGTPFDLMLFPGQRHGISGPPRRLQLWRTYLAFFARELAPK